MRGREEEKTRKLQRVKSQCFALMEGDLNALPSLLWNLRSHSGFKRSGILRARFPALLWLREYEKVHGKLGNGYPGSAMGEMDEDLIEAIAYGCGVNQDLYLARELYVDAWDRYKWGPCASHFVWGLINIGFTSADRTPEEVAMGKYDEELIRLLEKEEDAWLEDHGCPGEDVNIPWVSWWCPPADLNARVQRFQGMGENRDNLQDDYWSVKSFAYECGLYAQDAYRDMIGEFWCGDSVSVKLRIDAGGLDMVGKERAVELAARHFADDGSVLEAIDRRWPRAIETYRDGRGRDIEDRVRGELLFGAWRRFVNMDVVGKELRGFLEHR